MKGTNSILGGGGFHHVALNAREFDRSVVLYTDLLGFRPTVAWGDAATGNRGVLLDTGDGNYLEIFEKKDLPRSTGGPLFHAAFRTTDIHAAVERVRVAGFKITMEPKTIELNNTLDGPKIVPITVAFFEGPDGESIEFFQNELT